MQKYFKGKVELPFYNDKVVNLEETEVLEKQLIEILLSGKPGNFDYVHPNIDEFIEEVAKWKMD